MKPIDYILFNVKPTKKNSRMTFQERAKLGMEELTKQLPITLEKAIKQLQILKEQSASKIKKSRV
jgi:hypothetical protein